MLNIFRRKKSADDNTAKQQENSDNKMDNIKTKKQKDRNFVTKEQYRQQKQKRKEQAAKKREEEEKLLKKAEEKLKVKKQKEKELIESKRKEEFNRRQITKANSDDNPDKKRAQQKEKEDSFELFGFNLIDIEQGQTIEVEILEENIDHFVARVINNFQETILPKDELENEVNVGSILEVKVYRHTNDDFYVSEKRLNQDTRKNLFSNLAKEKSSIKGTIKSYNDPYFEVELDNGLKSKIYRDNLLLQKIENPQKYIDQEFDFVVKKRNNRGRKIYELTRVPILKQAQKEKLNKYHIGDKLSLGNFSKNKGGIETMHDDFRVFIPFKEISHEYVNKDSDLENIVSNNCYAEIIEIQNNKFSINIVCSIKNTLPDPLEKLFQEYEIDPEKEYLGTIIRIEKYGLFLEIQDGLRGLLHLNNATNEVGATIKEFKKGDQLNVKIKNINSEKRQIDLKM